MSVSVRIDEDLYRTIKSTANLNGVSVTKYLNSLLEKGLTKELEEYHRNRDRKPVHCPQCSAEGKPAIPAKPCKHMKE